MNTMASTSPTRTTSIAARKQSGKKTPITFQQTGRSAQGRSESHGWPLSRRPSVGHRIAHDAQCLGRIATRPEYQALRDWLAQSIHNRAILFHSGLYPHAQELFELYPEQVTFGDLHPTFSK